MLQTGQNMKLNILQVYLIDISNKNFGCQCPLSKELIPKGLSLKFNLELDKDNTNLKERCKEHFQLLNLLH
jgi:predicted transposase YbfD/YdcC